MTIAKTVCGFIALAFFGMKALGIVPLTIEEVYSLLPA